MAVKSHRRIHFFVALFLLAALTFACGRFCPVPAFAAGGPGDGSTSSEWMNDKRLLEALGAINEKKYSEAAKILTALVADKPDFANAWNYLGYSLRKSGDLERAEQAYLKALRLDREHRGVHEYLGELYLQTNRREKAILLERSLSRICQYGCPELDDLRAALKRKKSK